MPSPPNQDAPETARRHRPGRNNAVSPAERLEILRAVETNPRVTVASLARRFGRTRETITRVINNSPRDDRN
jgi:predicted HTH transcriptional regulator